MGLHVTMLREQFCPHDAARIIKSPLASELFPSTCRGFAPAKCTKSARDSANS